MVGFGGYSSEDCVYLTCCVDCFFAVCFDVLGLLIDLVFGVYL